MPLRPLFPREAYAMSDSPNISFRLSLDLQAAFSARVRQSSRMSDVIREPLEAHLSVRPTDRPTAPALSDTLAEVSDRLATLMLDRASEG
jgi:hypothetical protein